MERAYLKYKNKFILYILLSILVGAIVVINLSNIIIKIIILPYIKALFILLLFSITVIILEIINLRKFVVEKIVSQPNVVSKVVNKAIKHVVKSIILTLIIINTFSSIYFINLHNIPYLHQIIYGISVGIIIFSELLYSRRFFIIIVIIINILFICTQLNVITNFYADDPQIHKMYINNILSSGHIWNNKLYSDYPLMHIFVSEIVLISGFNVKISAIIGMSLVFIIIAILLFFIINIYGITAGIIGATIFFASGKILSGEKLMLWPTNFSSALMILCLYIFYISIKNIKNKLKLNIIYLILIIALAFSHSLTGLLSSLLIFTLGLIIVLSKTYERSVSRYQILLTSAIPLFIIISQMMYQGKAYFSKLIKILTKKTGIMVNFATPSGSLYAKIVPPHTYVLATLQNALFFTFAVLGTYILLNKAWRNRRNIDYIFLLYFSIISILLFEVSIIDNLLKLGLASDRFIYYSTLFFPIPISIYIWVSTRYSNQRRTLVKILLLILLIVISIPLSDNLVYNQVPWREDISPPRYVTYSEAYSLKYTSIFLKNYRIGTDNDFYHCIELKDLNKKILDFYKKEFNNIDIVIIRKSYLIYPIYSRGVYKVSYNIIKYFNIEKVDPKYDLIYSTSNIWIYKKAFV